MSSDEGQAASKFDYLAMRWALAPMVGPLFGGSLDELFGWRSSFVVFAILGAAAVTLSVRELKGIPPPRSKNRYLTSYVELLGSARFWAYTLWMACSMGVLYVFLGGAPLVVGDALGGSSAKLGFYMGLIPTGFILGSYLVAGSRRRDRCGLSSSLHVLSRV
jgi:predicted MFS family arabinose efflux permease